MEDPERRRGRVLIVGRVLLSVGGEEEGWVSGRGGRETREEIERDLRRSRVPPPAVGPPEGRFGRRRRV